MTKDKKSPENKKSPQNNTLIKYIAGCVLVVAGITMILLWFDDLAVIVRGSIGFIVALGGLLMLYSLKK